MEADKWGRRIRAFRKLKGFTQDSFSKELGVSVSVLGEIERGNRLPSAELLKRASQVLRVSIEDMAPPEE